MGSGSRGACLVAAVVLLTAYACAPRQRDPPEAAHVPALTPAQELATFRVADGFRVELVASEPMVQDPVAITFDARGRLWVVEMRGFMPDIDGHGEKEPVGRVSVLEDDDGDGRMDRSTVFLDGLVLPRAVAPTHGGALVGDQQRLWFARDTNGDGRADEKVLVDENYASLTGVGRAPDADGPVRNTVYPPNPEHSANGLLRGIDNWFYNAKSATRYRFRDGTWGKETTELRGQWGISQDDFGRLYYNYNWSQLHGDLVPPNYLLRNASHRSATGINLSLTSDQRVFPVRETRTINRGYREGVLDERGRAKDVTSAGAPLVYRGGWFGDACAGNVFVCDPALGLIKRNVVSEDGLAVSARQAYPDREFLASTDERFRPVWLTHGPEGALYVADMYRGFIQHGSFVTPYLREQTLKRGLDTPIHLGRIWRIVPTGRGTSSKVTVAGASPSQLVDMLSHRNGWVRDTAQRLLVESSDRSAEPHLTKLALRGSAPAARAHALWTLEGLGFSDVQVLLPALDDPHPKVQATATRVIESLAHDEATRATFGRALRKQAASPHPAVRLQALLSSTVAPATDRLEVALTVARRDADLPTTPDAVASSLAGLECQFLGRWVGAGDGGATTPGRAIIAEMLAAAVVRRGMPADVNELFVLLDIPPGRFGRQHEAVLAGIVSAGGQRRSPVRLPAVPAVLSVAHAFPEGLTRTRLESAASLFDWPGHSATAAPARAARAMSEAERSLLSQGRTLYLQTCAACHGPEGEGLRPLGPPLAGSEWVTGPHERLARIVLHGLEGPVRVKGKEYRPPEILESMPSLVGLTNLQYAAILTYVRNDWGNSAPAVFPSDIRAVLRANAGRTTPWTEAALLKIPEGP